MSRGESSGRFDSVVTDLKESLERACYLSKILGSSRRRQHRKMKRYSRAHQMEKLESVAYVIRYLHFSLPFLLRMVSTILSRIMSMTDWTGKIFYIHIQNDKSYLVRECSKNKARYGPIFPPGQAYRL